MSQSHSQTTRTSDHIEVMQHLLEEILHIQEKSTEVDKRMQRVQEIIVESSRVVENSTSTSEMIVDAKILHTGTSVVNSNVSSLNTNLTSFSESTYIRGIQSFLENSDRIVLGGKEWECLAPVTYHLFKKSHPITFMLGPFSLEPLPPREKSKAGRRKKSAVPQVTYLSTVTDRERAILESSDIYDHILKWLVRYYKRNDKKPISYLNFIIDPYDYWKTIENIFHFSFLVRDGSVIMTIIGGLPFVEPAVRNSEDTAPTTHTSHIQSNNYQFSFSLSMSEWRKCILKFGIGAPSIPPFISPF